MDEHEIDELYTEGTPMGQAIDIWRSGEPIPLDLAAELMGSGYDVAALETQYLTN